MRALRMTALIGLLVLTACQADRQATEPTGPTERVGPSLNNSTSACPSAAKLLVQIVAIVKPGQGRLATAIIKFDQIIIALIQRNIPKAQQRMFELLDFLIQEYNNGNLIGGKSTSTQTKLTTLTSGLYCLVGLPAPVIPAGALSADGAIGVVNTASPTTTLVNSTQFAGVQIPSGAASTAVLVTISRIPDAPPPLLTPLDKYPAFYEYHASPDGAFGSDVTIGVCVGTSAPNSIFGRLKIAHNVGTGVEILDRVEVPFALDCTALAMGPGASGLLGLALRGLGTFRDLMLPQVAQAATVGTCCVGGTTKKFSPFGAVDPVVYANVTSPLTVYGLPGSSVPAADLPRVRVLTLSQNPVPGDTVTFSTGGEGAISPTFKLTDASGAAALDSWTLGAAIGIDTVVATVTASPGTTVDSNPRLFQAQVIDPIQIPFAAAGYTYLLIGNGAPPGGWETESFTPTGWSSGNAAFGSGSGCGLSHATTWPIGTTSVPSDLLVRHSFLVPNGWTGTAKVAIRIDNDVQVFVNGTEVTSGFTTHENCANLSPPADLIVPNGLLHRGGTNLIAVRARDRGVESFFDLKLTLVP